MIGASHQRRKQTSRTAPTATAMLVHSALLLMLLHSSRISIAPMRLPGTARGTHTILTYLPGRAAQPAILARVAARQVAQQPIPVPAPVPVRETMTLSASTASSAPSQPDATHGNDALGTGDVNIALASSFPSPKPDLAPLPHGTSGDVVLDILIDAAGNVSSVTMSRGLGHGIDETVIATVQRWSFHPATRDGQPVPSEQELHFHYEKA